MFAKNVLLFCLYFFLVKTASCQVDSSDVIIEECLTEELYKALKGPDLCGTLDQNDNDVHKKACNEVAIREKLIKSGESLSFLEGYPKCIDVKIQLYECEQIGHDPRPLCIDYIKADGNVLDCSNTKKSFPIGKGRYENDLIMYKCDSQTNTCNAHYAMMGVFSN